MDPLTAITAQQKYEKLYQQHTNTEFRKTLESLKKACDTIEKIKGKMSYSAIVEISGHHVNTIKTDKEGHRAYIQLRQEEYTAKKKPSITSKADMQEVPVQKPRYPAGEGLDSKTRSFIDGLWLDISNLKNRNSMLEATHSNLKKAVLEQTREKPLDARQMLRGGPDDTGSMTIQSAGGDPPNISLTPKLRHALEKVLELGGHHESLYLDEKGSLMMKTPSQNFLLLLPRELQAISEAVGKEVPSSEQKLGPL